MCTRASRSTLVLACRLCINVCRVCVMCAASGVHAVAHNIACLQPVQLLYSSWCRTQSCLCSEGAAAGRVTSLSSHLIEAASGGNCTETNIGHEETLTAYKERFGIKLAVPPMLHTEQDPNALGSGFEIVCLKRLRCKTQLQVVSAKVRTCI